MRLTFPRISLSSQSRIILKILNPIQSNGLPSYLLGSYNHPQFGAINSSFVGQLVPADYNHNFGENAVIDSVIMRIPIYSRGVETSEDGDITYEIDSVYGGPNKNFCLQE